MKALQWRYNHYRLFHPGRRVFFLLAQSNLNHPLTISVSPLMQSFPPPQQHFWEPVSWLSSFWKGPNFFFFFSHMTTFTEVLKNCHIRPPLPPTLSTLPFTSLPLNGHFHLKDAWCLSNGMLEMVLSLSPVVEMDIEWRAAIETPFTIFHWCVSGWENEAAFPLANTHFCQQTKWNITCMLQEGMSLSSNCKTAPYFTHKDLRDLSLGNFYRLSSQVSSVHAIHTVFQYCSNCTFVPTPEFSEYHIPLLSVIFNSYFYFIKVKQT